jgi:hypothetical protein
MKTGALVLGVTLLAASPLGAQSELNMRVSPLLSSAPATVMIQIIVAPDEDNRAIAIAAEGDAYFRSSSVPLDGADAPHVIALEYRNLPPGTYEIRGVLLGTSGKQRAMTRRSITVTGLDF